MKIENPFVKALLFIISIPIAIYLFLLLCVWGMDSHNSVIASALIPTLVFVFIIYKAIQWQIRKNRAAKTNSEDSVQ